MPTDNLADTAKHLAAAIERGEWCMCGERKVDHDQSSNHAFVPMEVHPLDEIEAERERCQAGNFNPNIDYEALILREDEIFFDD